METAGSITVNNSTDTATLPTCEILWLKARSTNAAVVTVKVSRIHGSTGVVLEAGDAVPLVIPLSAEDITITLTSTGSAVLDYTKVR